MLWEFELFSNIYIIRKTTSEKLLRQATIKKLNCHHKYGTILANIFIILLLWVGTFAYSTKPHVQLIIIPNNEYGKYYPGAAARPEYGSIYIDCAATSCYFSSGSHL